MSNDIEVMDCQIEQDGIAPGDIATITGTVSNTNDRTGATFDLVVNLNGEPVGSFEYDIKSDSSTDYELEVSISEEGKYDVTVTVDNVELWSNNPPSGIDPQIEVTNDFGGNVNVHIDLFSDDDTLYEGDAITATVGSEEETENGWFVQNHNIYEFNFTLDDGTYDWEVDIDGYLETGTIEVEDDGSGTGTPTFTVDYDQFYDPNRPRNGLNDAYDLVEDTRTTGEAYLSQSDPTTVGNTVNVQSSGGGGCPSKSSNSLVQFDKRVGHLPQEVYFEYDLLLDGNAFTLQGDDTYRFFWNMNRYGTNDYDSTTGHGWSNGIGVTSRGNPPAGHYNFFSYSYDTRGASKWQPTNYAVPTGQWITLSGYVKCNDIGSQNAVMKYWCDDDLMQRIDGFATSANQDAWCHEFGPQGYYTYCNAQNAERMTYFDNPRYYVGDDIPAGIRE